MTDRNGAIIFYSLTGHTKRAARRLAEMTQGDLFEWTSDRYGPSGFGVLRAIFDTLRGVRPPGTTPIPDLAPYNWLVLAGPVWVGRPAAPLASLIEATRRYPGPTALLLTSKDDKMPDGTFAMCERLCGSPFSIQLHLPNALEDTSEPDRRLAQFAITLQGAPRGAAE